MKRMLFFVFILIISNNLFGQVINEDFFPEDNWIDSAYLEELDNIMGPPSEITMLIFKYIELWEIQMNLELERLATVLDEDSREILYESHDLWEKAFENYNNLVSENININWLGLIPLQDYQQTIMDAFRERAVAYCTLFYTILDHRDEGLDYESIGLAE